MMNPLGLDDILDLLKEKANRPLSLKDIQTQFNLKAGERKNLGRLLKSLVREGHLVQLKGGRFALPHKINLVIGTLQMHRDGYGFVVSNDNREDVFVPARHIRPAMHGDRVIVRIERGRQRGRPEGRVIRVEQRANQRIVGRYEISDQGYGYIVPADPKILEDLLVKQGAEGEANCGEMVVADIESFPDRARAAIARVIEVLGRPDDPKVEIKVSAIRFNLPYEFSKQCINEAALCSKEISPGDLAGREDLRHYDFVTIDGESAQDFDDAVAIERDGDEGYRLYVAIADVAHYVQAGSVIDQEALARGTSVYFPGACLPMLPEALSNGICSLKPGVDRLVMVAEMNFDSTGKRRTSKFYPGVIKSVARLTYTEVASVLLQPKGGQVMKAKGLIDNLKIMASLAKLLMRKRHDRGSLDLDLPEADIHLDLRGRPEKIVRSERNLAHQLIEEFMLAANESVADNLTRRNLPMIYRVHEQPSDNKIAAFQEFIAHFNQGLSIPPEGLKPGILQALLERVSGRPEEQVINHVLLRSLPQAYYTTVNQGHFGLASNCYCHFTSPIRRYPDLVLHRILKQSLARSKPKAKVTSLPLDDIAQQSSQCERRALEAERDIVDLKKCQFMVDKVGETYPGLIISVQAFGFFVELQEFFVEGLVHVSSLEDDFYEYDEDRHQLIGMNRRRRFEIGTKVQVTVQKVDLERREIDFKLLDSGKTPPKRRKSKNPRRQGR